MKIENYTAAYFIIIYNKLLINMIPHIFNKRAIKVNNIIKMLKTYRLYLWYNL